MVKEYLITFAEGVDKSEYYSEVENITYDYPARPKLLLAELSDVQKQALENNQNVKFVVDYNEMKARATASDCATRSVTYHRYVQDGYQKLFEGNTSANLSTVVKANYGLIRHTSATNNTSTDTDVTTNYTYNYDGTGVDLILHLASVLDLQDPEFMTSGATRIQQLQWNTVSGMSNIPTVDYSKTGSDIDDHAEAVAYLCASNTYGWATGATIYIWPRDQMVNAAGQDQTEEWSWDAIRLWHQNKGNSRPTIVVSAIGYDKGFLYDESLNKLHYRGSDYTTINPAGAGDFPVPETSTKAQGACLKAFGLEYGNGHYKMPNTGNFYLFNHSSLRPLDTLSSALVTHSDTPSNNAMYASHMEPIEDMIAAGVHHVAAAGNNGCPVHLPSHPDYDNFTATGTTTGDRFSTPTTKKHFNLEFYTRPSLIMGGDTIVCANIDMKFGTAYGFGGKEHLEPTSNRGTRVDCAAVGTNIPLDLRSNGYYRATGTSFASPNIGGMACLVLEKYPSTTPAQLRKYFRDHAVGTDKLYDSGLQPVISSKYGDAAYEYDFAGLKGYSGNIAYLDPSLTFDPTTITNTSITSTVTLVDNEIDYTTAQINTKLATLP